LFLLLVASAASPGGVRLILLTVGNQVSAGFSGNISGYDVLDSIGGYCIKSVSASGEFVSAL
jgi:hypothetical protein